MNILLLATAAMSPWTAGDTEEFYPDRHVQGWTVYGFAEDCWMYRNYPDGTRLNFSIDAERSFYLSAHNPKWKGIKQDGSYMIQVDIGGRRSVEDATGHNRSGDDPNFVFFFQDPRSTYAAVRGSAQISLSIENRAIGTYSLAGAGSALRVMEECAAKIPTGTGDPFAGTSMADPFSS